MRRQRQRGVAVVTALLLTTLAVTIVASLFWQQQVQVRSMENQRLRLQTRWIVRGALDLSRLVLNQDVMNYPNYTPQDGIWATPLEETRLDDYVERERLQGERYDATLSGRMVDAQSRYNLSNLATARVPNNAEVEVFRRLLSNLRLDSGLASAVASLVASAQTLPGASQQGSSEPLGLLRAEDLLAVSGFTPQAVQQLRDYVIVLPTTAPTPLNVNTAPAELIAALVPGLSLSDAAAMVSTRKTVFYRQRADFTSVSQMSGRRVTASWDVRSDYFLAYSRVKLDRASLDTQSLLHRPGKVPATTVVWIREY